MVYRGYEYCLQFEGDDHLWYSVVKKKIGGFAWYPVITHIPTTWWQRLNLKKLIYRACLDAVAHEDMLRNRPTHERDNYKQHWETMHKTYERWEDEIVEK